MGFSSDSEVFITARMHPVSVDGQAVQIWCNGYFLASYEVSAPSDLTAIMPADYEQDDNCLRLEFRSSTLFGESRNRDGSETRRSSGLILEALCIS